MRDIAICAPGDTSLVLEWRPPAAGGPAAYNLIERWFPWNAYHAFRANAFTVA